MSNFPGNTDGPSLVCIFSRAGKISLTTFQTIDASNSQNLSMCSHSVTFHPLTFVRTDTGGGPFGSFNTQVTAHHTHYHTPTNTTDTRLPYVPQAAYHCQQRDRCLDGTRKDVLRQVADWIRQRDGVSTTLAANAGPSPSPARIFWVNGLAGTGKSTIACTVAEALARYGILGASFFCSRDDAECSNPNLIIPTITQQLALFHNPFKTVVSQVLESHPYIGRSDVSYQLEVLIVEPLRNIRHSFPPCVIVLDALDECKDPNSTSIILSSISRFVSELAPLKFFITSRPEERITLAFGTNEMQVQTQKLNLHEVALSAAAIDIAHYLSWRLFQIRKRYFLEDSWPPVTDIEALVRESHGLFIFAATSARFIEDENYCNPPHQLTALLNRSTIEDGLPGPHQHLDGLYAKVLSDAFPSPAPILRNLIKDIVGSIVLLQDPLSSFSLSKLLNRNHGEITSVLSRLHAIIDVPNDQNRVIRFLHPSFPDFATDPTRCHIPDFLIDNTTHHTSLAIACLFAMKALRRDICDIRDPTLLDSEVPNLRDRIQQNLPPHLQYACRHWATHIVHSETSDELLGLLEEFFSTRILFWVEACALLQELRNSLLGLDICSRKLAVRPSLLTNEFF